MLQVTWSLSTSPLAACNSPRPHGGREVAAIGSEEDAEDAEDGKDRSAAEAASGAAQETDSWRLVNSIFI